MNNATECPVDSLPAFLNDELDERLRSGIIEHLDECEQCRARLTDEAGSADDWAIASEALADDAALTAAHDAQLTTAKHLPQREPFDATALLQLLSPTDDPRAAGRIGPFEITGIVGSGGMGIVLKARDPALDRYVAIKLLSPHLASSPSARQRFAREARAAAAVIHDNVIAIYQVAHWNDLPYLVMPYLPDPTLQARIDSCGKLDLESTLSVSLQIARGLAAAHSQGLVHRDVKPANVLLSKGTERAVITDFGLARATDDASLTRAGMLAGTPHYMSPEQARGEVVDQRSDLFSLGSVLFAMIAGRPPVDHDLGSETISLIAQAKLPSLDAVNPETPPWMQKLVAWLHQPRPTQRPESTQQVADLLEQCLAHVRQPGKTPLPEALLNSRRAVKRPQLLAGGLIIAFAAVLGIGIMLGPADDTATESNTLGNTQQIESQPTETQWSSVNQILDETTRDAARLQSDIDDFWQTLPDEPEHQQ